MYLEFPSGSMSFLILINGHFGALLVLQLELIQRGVDEELLDVVDCVGHRLAVQDLVFASYNHKHFNYNVVEIKGGEVEEGGDARGYLLGHQAAEV